jgi:intracellular sulfur oxidation DsrE/DsrF family protein
MFTGVRRSRRVVGLMKGVKVSLQATCMVIVAGVGTSAAYAQAQHHAQAPWGTSAPATHKHYQASKAVYDVAQNDPKALNALLDRISGLDAEYSHDPFDASIVVVLHGPELKFFDTRNFSKYEELVRRAQSLSVGTAISFRVCQRSAGNQGIAPENLHGFLQLVPMGDAEIVKLQQQGYAYMR